MNWLFCNRTYRIGITGACGALILLFVEIIAPARYPAPPIYYLDVAIAFILFTEGLFLIDKRLNISNPWFQDFRKRFIKQFLYGTICTFAVAALMLLKNYNSIVSNQSSIRAYILAIIFGICNQYMINSILATRTFLKERQKREMEREKLKRDKLKADYNLLQNQLNPYFLFNSLNILLSEIRHNRSNAISYCENLADVYRYILQSRNQDTVSLKTEKDGFEKYLYLLKTRFGNNIEVDFNIDVEVDEYRIPPLIIGILIENAIKHNVSSESKPLKIDISIVEEELVITNNMQPRKKVISSGFNLKNVIQRYSLLTEKKVRTIKTGTDFKVIMPLFGE